MADSKAPINMPAARIAMNRNPSATDPTITTRSLQGLRPFGQYPDGINETSIEAKNVFGSMDCSFTGDLPCRVKKM
jgi:hypothetical protein